MKSTYLAWVLMVACLILGGSQNPARAGLQPAVPNQTVEGIKAAQDLIGRVLPGRVTEFICEPMAPTTDGRDVFEIVSRNGKVVLRGNNGVSLAMALHWYLHYVAHTDYDWQATGPLTLAGDLPLPTAPIHQECLARERFFLNYCTYGYTFPYLNAAGWQRFLDWLALNGVNRPLLQGGQEAVWLEVWQKYGLTTNQVLAYFTGHLGISTTMRAHEGIGTAQAHLTVSTAPMSISIAFHEPVDWTGWLLYTHESTQVGAGMSYVRGTVHSEGGELLASFAQEALIRPLRTSDTAIDSRARF